MYCPSCGSEERQLSQFCRACGTDLRVVRNSLERPDAITASAVSAREHIGLAIADQIRQMRTGKDLEHVAEEVLPAFEKFLESPEERRLRRIRAGVITASIGFAFSIVSLVVAMANGDFFLIMPGFVVFMIGLAIVINGLLFTVPRKQLPGAESDALAQEVLDAIPHRTSVTEHTTHNLKPTKS